MTTSKLLIAAIAMSTALATPAFAQWQSQEPAAYAAQYPNGDRNLASPATRETMAFVPSPKSPRPTVMRATKGK
jgi:predicted lipid-binding transport protein (Tim44 family)